MFTEQVLSDQGTLSVWDESSCELVSWWHMHQFSMRIFFAIGLWLERLKEELLAEGSGQGDELFNSALLHRPVSDKMLERARKTMVIVDADECEKLGLAVSAGTIREFKKRLDNSEMGLDYNTLMTEILAIQKMMDKEMKNRRLIYVTPERVRYFGVPEDPVYFGAKTIQAFPSALYDAWEASRCMGFMRYTAAVFHLMRVLEIGLTVLGGEFGVSLTHTNWAPAIEEIEKRIREMHKDPKWKGLPDCKELQEFYAQTASNFGVLKDAYRNLTMHTRGKFNEEEAERLFINIKAFMAKLAERLHE